MSDYLKLAREAREAYLGDPSETCAGGLFVPALCDAIEAQAVEIEKLRAVAVTAQRWLLTGADVFWANLRDSLDEVDLPLTLTRQREPLDAPEPK